MIPAPGVTSSIINRLRGRLPIASSAPVSTTTGSGTPAVVLPQTVAPPANAVDVVSQQLASSQRLAENTATGAGIGAGKNILPVTTKIPTHQSFVWLTFLGVLLILAYAWDRGKL